MTNARNGETPRTDALLESMTTLTQAAFDEEPQPVWEADFPRLLKHTRQLERENAKLLDDRRRLIAVAQQTINEVGWFVSRKKDLASRVLDEDKIWAETLDEDLNPLRALLTELEPT